MAAFPVDTGRKSNLHKMFRRRPGHLLNSLCTFSLRPVSIGLEIDLFFTHEHHLNSNIRSSENWPRKTKTVIQICFTQGIALLKNFIDFRGKRLPWKFLSAKPHALNQQHHQEIPSWQRLPCELYENFEGNFFEVHLRVTSRKRIEKNCT